MVMQLTALIDFISTSQWRYNGHDGVSNHQPHDCLLNHLFGCISKERPKLHVTGHCAGSSLVTGEFPAQMPSNTENVFVWWRHHKGQRSLSSGVLSRTMEHHLAAKMFEHQILQKKQLYNLRPLSIYSLPLVENDMMWCNKSDWLFEGKYIWEKHPMEVTKYTAHPKSSAFFLVLLVSGQFCPWLLQWHWGFIWGQPEFPWCNPE